MVGASAQRVALVVTALLCAEPAWAGRAGRVISVRGNVTIQRVQGGDTVTLTRGASLEEGDIVSTKERASARFLMEDRSVLSLGAESQITIREYASRTTSKKRTVRVKLWLGRLWARVTKSVTGTRDYRVETDNAVAGVRGTSFVAHVPAGGGLNLTVLEGSVALEGLDGRELQLLGELQQGRVGRQGRVEVEPVTRAQANEARREAGGQALDNGGTQNRAAEAQRVIPEPPPEGQSGPENAREQGPTDPVEDVPNPATLDLDPGNGNSRVRIQVEVRE